MTDQPERQEGAAEADGARKAALRRVSADGLPGLFPSGDTPKGECTGLLLGVKPAMLVDATAIPPSASDVFRSAGIEPMLENRLLANPAAIYLRLATEPEFADWAGWKGERSLQENLREASVKIADDPRRQALAGFLLGFPESAVRGFVRELELGRSGIHDFRTLIMRTMNGFREEKDPAVLAAMDTPWLKEAAGELRRLKDRVWEEAIDEDPAERGRRMDDEERFLRDLAPKAKELYRRALGLSDEDAERLSSEDHVVIRNPAGQPVYTFRTYGPRGAEAEDVEDLRSRVEKAFAGAW